MKYLLFFLILFNVNNAFACSPIYKDPAFKEWYVIERYNEADLIIRGKFININIVEDRVAVGNTFEIIDPASSNIILTEVYKGDIPTKLLIEFKSGFCGQSIKPETEYLIYAKKQNNTYAFTESPIAIENSAIDLKVLKEIKYKFINPKTVTKSHYQKPKK